MGVEKQGGEAGFTKEIHLKKWISGILSGLGIPPTPDRAPNPHFLEKRAPGSKPPPPISPRPHTTWKREFSVKKNPFSLCSLVTL